ncbi:hypothetical protein [Massilia sp. METH4]
MQESTRGALLAARRDALSPLRRPADRADALPGARGKGGGGPAHRYR